MEPSFNWSLYLTEFARCALANRFVARELAETPAGPVMAWESVADGPRIYLSAGIHGDEPAGPLALLSLMQQGAFVSNVEWSICPAINPSGLSVGSRDNHRGVDLNRDYRARVSEEVAAHARWLEARAAPELFLSLHEDWETPHFYLYEINTGADDPAVASGIIQAVDRWFAPDPGPLIDEHVPRAPGWIFHEPEPDDPHGWPEAIFLAKHGCPLSFTFETPSQGALEDRVKAQCAAVRAALRATGMV
jgi:predicted deacylase